MAMLVITRGWDKWFWLVIDLPLWKIYLFVSWDDYSIPNWMESHNPVMFQTTNQIYIILLFQLLTIINHRLTRKNVPNHQSVILTRMICPFHSKHVFSHHWITIQDTPAQLSWPRSCSQICSLGSRQSQLPGLVNIQKNMENHIF